MRINIEKIKQEFPKIAKEKDLHLGLLFGSQASGKTHPQSDVDIAVMGSHRFGPMELARLSFEFSRQFNIPDTKLEVADIKAASPLLLKNIATQSVLLYEKERDQFDYFRVYALKRYMEAKPLRQAREASLKQYIHIHGQ